MKITIEELREILNTNKRIDRIEEILYDLQRNIQDILEKIK